MADLLKEWDEATPVTQSEWDDATPANPDPFSVSAKDARNMRNKFIRDDAKGVTKPKELALDALRHPLESLTQPSYDVQPAKGVFDPELYTRVIPQSTANLIPNIIQGVKQLTDRTDKDPVVDASNKMRSVLKSAATPFGLAGTDAASHAWMTDPVGTALTAYGATKLGKPVAGNGLSSARSTVANARLPEFLGGDTNTTLPRKLVESGMKMSKSARWRATASAEELSRREQALQGVMEGDIPLSSEGVEIADNLKNQQKTAVADKVRKLDDIHGPVGISRIGAAAKLDTSSIQPILDELFPDKGQKVEGPPVRGLLGSTVRSIEKGYTPSEMQYMKTELHKNSDYLRAEPMRTPASRAKEIGFKKATRALKVTLEGLDPTIKGENRKLASYGAAKEAVDIANARISDNNIFSLGLKAGSSALMHNPLTAITGTLGAIFGAPRAKVALGRYLNKFSDNPIKVDTGTLPEKTPPYTPYEVPADNRTRVPSAPEPDFVPPPLKQRVPSAPGGGEPAALNDPLGIRTRPKK